MIRRPLRALLLLAAVGGPLALAGPLEEAEALMARGDHAAARERLLEAAKAPGLEARAQLLLTRACNAEGDWEAGVKHGARAVELLPESSEAHFEYAVAVRIKLTNISRVRAIFSAGDYKKSLHRALELDPGNLDAREEEIGYLSQAPSIAGGDKDKARQRIEELKRLDWRRGSFVDAEIRRALGQDGEVGAIYREILARHPDDAKARRELASWHQRREEYAEADRHLESLARSDDEREALAARYQIARSRVVGQYDLARAVNELDAYIAALGGADRRGLAPRAAAWWRLGMAHEQLEAPERARACYGRALELDPDFEQARKALAALDKKSR